LTLRCTHYCARPTWGWLGCSCSQKRRASPRGRWGSDARLAAEEALWQ
jgi:hypothetical protein